MKERKGNRGHALPEGTGCKLSGGDAAGQPCALGWENPQGAENRRPRPRPWNAPHPALGPAPEGPAPPTSLATKGTLSP